MQTNFSVEHFSSTQQNDNLITQCVNCTTGEVTKIELMYTSKEYGD